jgi:hypothetical protein
MVDSGVLASNGYFCIVNINYLHDIFCRRIMDRLLKPRRKRHKNSVSIIITPSNIDDLYISQRQSKYHCAKFAATGVKAKSRADDR